MPVKRLYIGGRISMIHWRGRVCTAMEVDGMIFVEIMFNICYHGTVVKSHDSVLSVLLSIRKANPWRNQLIRRRSSRPSTSYCRDESNSNYNCSVPDVSVVPVAAQGPPLQPSFIVASPSRAREARANPLRMRDSALPPRLSSYQ